jgi:hypothetical protein
MVGRIASCHVKPTPDRSGVLGNARSPITHGAVSSLAFALAATDDNEEGPLVLRDFKCLAALMGNCLYGVRVQQVFRLERLL